MVRLLIGLLFMVGLGYLGLTAARDESVVRVALGSAKNADHDRRPASELRDLASPVEHGDDDSIEVRMNEAYLKQRGDFR